MMSPVMSNTLSVFLRGFRRHRVAAALALAAIVVAGWSAGGRAQVPQTNLPLDPIRERGNSITPAFEGWFPNDDGSFSLLLGYYNRNTKEALDIPIGPNNRVEPGGPDQGQPTHFETGRQWGVFVVKVPKDFGAKKITWTIVANGETQAIPFILSKGYPISPYKELGMGNQPPTLAFAQGGAKVTGPPTAVASTFEGGVGKPVAISIWVEDPKPSGEGAAPAGRGSLSVATVSFHKFRGPGAVTFDKARIPVQKQGDMISTAATFAAPGEYLLRVQANDESGEGGGGFQCCWTNTYVKVTVK
jgi:hypothetical protein